MNHTPWTQRARPLLLGTMMMLATGCPQVFEVQPNPAEAGQSITVTGNLFGAAQGSAQLVYDGQPLTITSWSNTEIEATLPDPIADGTYSVQVTGVNGALFSNFFSHMIGAPGSSLWGQLIWGQDNWGG